MGNSNTISYSGLFSTYQDAVLLSKVREYARITIPTVFPDLLNANPTGNSTYEGDYQSYGSYITANLASKLARTLFPVNTTFFKVVSDPEIEKLLKQQDKDNLTALVNKACQNVFKNASYAQLVQALRLLVITGDVIVKRTKDQRIQVYSMQSYGLKRNNVGDVLDCVICEKISVKELSDEVIVKCNLGNLQDTDTVKLYTRINKVYNNGIPSWKESQELNGVKLDYTATYADKACPYIFVAWNLVNGDNYGHGHVEDNSGDLQKLSDLSYELTRYQLASTRVLNLVGSGANFDVAEACEAETGDFVKGSPSEVKPFEFGDSQKMIALHNEIMAIKSDLAVAFMYQGNTRDAERVTQFEIQQNAMEAEQVLGGVYSQLAQGLHLPLSYILMSEVDSEFIPLLHQAKVDIQVLTGLQALNQVNDNQALVISANLINQVAPVLQSVSKEYNIEAVCRLILQNQGVDLKSITYTPEELEQRMQQEQQQQAMQQEQIAQQQQLQAQQATELSQGGTI